MATNAHFTDPTTLSLPVDAGTTSGDPVIVGVLPGVALTDRGAGGNITDEATIAIRGAFDLPVLGPVTVGAQVYIDSGDLSTVNTGTAYGIALASIAGATTATIPVLIGVG